MSQLEIDGNFLGSLNLVDQKTFIVLCLDKDHHVLQLMKRVLEATQHYEVLTCSDIDIAREVLFSTEVDLVFLDMTFEEQDFQTITKVAHHFPNLATILVAGAVRCGMSHVMTQKRCHGILHKPFTTEMLIDAVNRVLGVSYGGQVGCDMP